MSSPSRPFFVNWGNILSYPFPFCKEISRFIQLVQSKLLFSVKMPILQSGLAFFVTLIPAALFIPGSALKVRPPELRLRRSRSLQPPHRPPSLREAMRNPQRLPGAPQTPRIPSPPYSRTPQRTASGKFRPPVPPDKPKQPMPPYKSAASAKPPIPSPPPLSLPTAPKNAREISMAVYPIL